jgi:nitrite reductase (NADH) large subunit
MGVSRGELGEAIQQGYRSVAELSAFTSASTVCGSCRPLLTELVEGAPTAQPVRVWKPLLAGAVVTLLIALMILLLPGIRYPDTVQLSIPWDQLWRAGLLKQISGFSILGLSVLALLLSLQKRWRRIRLGDFALWRLTHVVLGIAGMVLLLVHTGGRAGSNLDFLLMSCFSLLLLLGGFAAAFIGLEHRLIAGPLQNLRKPFLWLHILVFWPVPVLLGFHIFKTYYY